MTIDFAIKLRLEEVFRDADNAGWAAFRSRGQIPLDFWYDVDEATYSGVMYATLFSPQRSISSGLRTHEYKPRVDTARAEG